MEGREDDRCADVAIRPTNTSEPGGRARSSKSVSMPDPTPIVFVVDDDVSVRESLELLIRHAGWRPEMLCVGAGVPGPSRTAVPSCLVLDVSLPGLNGLELQKQLVERTEMPIIFITGYGDIPMTVQAMKAGAVEFLTKPFEDEVLLTAIRHALERSRAGACTATRTMRTAARRYASLTPREREVMVLVVSGLLNKQVGGRTRNQRDHREGAPRQVMRKMKADSLPDLVTMAARLELPPNADGQARRNESRPA